MTDRKAYQTERIRSSELQPGYTLVGQMGGLSTVIEVTHNEPSGIVLIDTEHGRMAVTAYKGLDVLSFDVPRAV